MRHYLPIVVLAASVLVLGGGGPGIGAYWTTGGNSGVQRERPDFPRSVLTTSKDGTMVIRDLTELSLAGSRHVTLSIAADGQCTLVATVNGERVFEGPCTTEAQRAKVPAELWMAVRMAYYRDQLGLEVGDEWTVVGSKIEAVVKLQDQLKVGFDGDPRRTPSGLGRDDPLAQATEALTQESMPGPSNGDLKAVMTHFRDARKKLQDDLTGVQRALQMVVTLRQEAILIRLGLLP